MCDVSIAAKCVLYVICRRITTPSTQALALDHRNDVISNTVAVACGIIGIELASFFKDVSLCLSLPVSLVVLNGLFCGNVLCVIAAVINAIKMAQAKCIHVYRK